MALWLSQRCRGFRVNRNRAKQLLPLALVLLLAALPRFYCLGCQSLWSDEGNSVALTRLSFAEIARRTAFDIHPPLYYWLLKIWVALFGSGEVGLRSLSAALGVGVVWLTWAIGRRLFGGRVALLAAGLAALSPLLVYYSQEARMYMLLTFLSGLTALLAVEFWAAPRRRLAVVYALTVAAGLYTHYAYPVVLAAINLAALLHFLRRSPLAARYSSLVFWLALQLVPLLMYVPWLPVAWRQLTTWPAETHVRAATEILTVIPATLWFGLSWPYATGLPALGLTLLAVALPVIGERRNAPALGLLYGWFGLPVLLTAAVFSPAFLKFLVVAAPPLAVLLALAATRLAALWPRRRIGPALAGALLAVAAGAALPALNQYFTNPAFARDNYRGVAQFIRAVAGPNDAVILNAEGQQDVFNYYYPASADAPPVFPLPRRRPLNQADTLAELERIAAHANKIYAVYWAQQQADPAGIIAGWLDAHLFKAADQWFGNVRLVSYASPRQNIKLSPREARLGDSIRLTGYGLAANQVAPGDILQVALSWQTGAPLAEDYTVFLQVLDGANQLVGQRDAPPLTPAPVWPVNQPVADAHGIFIEPGTPPGRYRLIAGLYHSQTGQRLPVASGADFVELGPVEVVSPDTPLPAAAFKMQIPLRAELPGVTLLGYDFYKVGYRSAPDTPLHPGDAAQLAVYWMRSAGPAAAKNGVQIRVVDSVGRPTGVEVTGNLAAADYPPPAWRAGEIVRGQFTLFLNGLKPGRYRLEFAVPESGQKQTALGEPFVVE